jgi:hypothetical protein
LAAPFGSSAEEADGVGVTKVVCCVTEVAPSPLLVYGGCLARQRRLATPLGFAGGQAAGGGVRWRGRQLVSGCGGGATAGAC